MVLRRLMTRVTYLAIAISFGVVGCAGDQKKDTVTPKKYAQKVTDKDAPKPVGDADQPAAKPAATPAAAPVAAKEDSGDASSELAAKDAPAPTTEVADAEAMVRRGRYLDAIRKAKAALRKSEKYAPAMEIMARAYFHLGKMEFAEAICDTAIGIEPKSGKCFNLKGFIALKDENKPLALKHFKKATQALPSYGAGWLNLGAQYLNVKNYTAAQPVLERAVELMGSRAEAHLNLGAAYRGNGKLLKALESFKQALKLRANYPAALFNLGILYLDAATFPGVDKLTQLATAETYLRKYKNFSPSGNKDDPVNTYLEAVAKGVKKENRRLKRIERRKKRDERKRARDAAKKAEAAKGAAAGADKKAADQ